MSLTCDDLKAHLAEILLEWHTVAGEQPWLSLPPEHRVNHLPQLIRELSDAALCTPIDIPARLRTLNAAVRHGEERRAHGFSDGHLLTEYILLREALWRYIRQAAPLEEAGPAIMRIDSAITLASRASLYGYHASELRELGRSVVDLLTDLLDQWPIEKRH